VAQPRDHQIRVDRSLRRRADVLCAAPAGRDSPIARWLTPIRRTLEHPIVEHPIVEHPIVEDSIIEDSVS